MEPQTQTQTQPTPADHKVDSTFPTQNLNTPQEENKLTNVSDTHHVDESIEKDKVTTKSESNAQTNQKRSTTENVQTQIQAQHDKQDDKNENKNPKQQAPEAKDVNSTHQSQPNSKPDQPVTRKASQTKEPKSSNSVEDKKDSQILDNKNKKQSGPETNDQKAENQSQAKAKAKDAEKNPKTDQSSTRKDSQNKEPKSHESLTDKGSQINTGRSEVLTNREPANKAVKTKSQEVKDKIPQVKSPTSQQNQTKSKSKIEEKGVKSEPTLEGAFSSIFNFFSSAKNNIAESSSKSAAKFEEIVMKSKIVTTIQGTDYQAVITSDVFKKGEGKEEKIAESQKPQRSKVNRSQVKVSTKVAPEKPKKVQADKNTNKPDSVVEKPVKEHTVRRTISKPKAKAEGSPGVSPVRAKNEVEEQIRLHKIEEIKRSKKVLQDKLDALNDQLFELQKPSIVYHENVSPTQVAFSMEQYKKSQKEEELQKKKEAQEFARKMLKERKDLEQKRDQRRDKNQALMIKEIDVLYQKQLNDLDTLKGASSVKTKFENNIKKFKEENMFATLEQRKKDLKMARAFHKRSNNNTDPVDQTNGEEANPEEEKKVKAKPYKKPLYVSPVLDQVLKEDEERKKTDLEKLQARKNLHKKQVEYGKEVKSSHLPQVHTSKYFESDDKLTRAVYRSVNMEKNLVRLAGKDGLYNYLEKMKNKYPDLAKPRKDAGNDSHHRYDDEDIKPKKSKAKPQQRNQEEEEEEVHNESEDERRDHRDYEVEENWDLTDRTGRNEEEPRDSYPKEKGIKNLKGQSHQPNKRSTNQDINTPNDSRISERSRHNQSQTKVPKRHQVEQKDAEGADEDNEWEQELKEDQEVLKNKIANMLGDIKQMESQIKQKEEALIKDIENKKLVNE